MQRLKDIFSIPPDLEKLATEVAIYRIQSRELLDRMKASPLITDMLSFKKFEADCAAAERFMIARLKKACRRHNIPPTIMDKFLADKERQHEKGILKEMPVLTI